MKRYAEIDFLECQNLQELEGLLMAGQCTAPYTGVVIDSNLIAYIWQFML